MYATEDGGHETLKAAAVLGLGVVIFPAIVPAPPRLMLTHVATKSPTKPSATRTSVRCLQFVLSLKIYHFN